MPNPAAFMAKTCNQITANNVAPVDPLELVRVQPLFQSRNCLVQQVAPTAGKQPHIIALGLDPFDIDGCDADQFGAV